MLTWTFQSDQIIFHGLYNRRLLILLLSLFLRSKVTWVIWGGDLPLAQDNTLKRRLKWKLVRLLAPRIDRIVTLDDGDRRRFEQFAGLRKVTFFSGRYPNPISFSRIARAIRRENKTVRILIGNSATASNQHITVFRALAHLKGPNVEFIVPLGYGDSAYKQEVLAEGRALLGDSFRPIERTIPIEEYIDILTNVNAAIFYMPRQQALSNIFGLIAIGRKLLLHPQSGVIENLKKTYGINLWSFDDFLAGDRSLESLLAADEETLAHNRESIKKVYDHSTLLGYWNDILDPRRLKEGH